VETWYELKALSFENQEGYKGREVLSFPFLWLRLDGNPLAECFN
jgi:hypothetical protein